MCPRWNRKLMSIGMPPDPGEIPRKAHVSRANHDAVFAIGTGSVRLRTLAAMSHCDAGKGDHGGDPTHTAPFWAVPSDTPMSTQCAGAHGAGQGRAAPKHRKGTFLQRAMG